jgi:predicted glutamine amidotransferase
MCELMCMSFAKPLVASVSIRAFGLRSVENADGWGLAWYPDRSLSMVKQPVRWTERHSEFLDHYPGLISPIYIAHVRHKTTGGAPTRADTHPFSREFEGREYCLAHNGTLKGDFWKERLSRFHPIGTTDSENLFCLVMSELEKLSATTSKTALHGPPSDPLLTTEEQWKSIHEFLLRINRFGTLNCIFSDGERVAVYHDLTAWKGLTYRHIYLSEDSQRLFADSTLAVDLKAQPVNYGLVVATNPLSPAGWERFAPGELKVLHQGKIEFEFVAPPADAQITKKSGAQTKPLEAKSAKDSLASKLEKAGH